ncbi:unnamed protein product [Bursaphelenchus xylophilus]|uniref:(pine wood nematode) hypothetical protein n=1 Tax=Bursaphelenchus xylophilus TaxID=6326 RepID=A0A1I7SR71_BURXY|nr:unnamed protein product [Bursaphelenchus xylophilus]CAG9110920.1 unnamed protein product [Bursaphelenchus xylophilus]
MNHSWVVLILIIFSLTEKIVAKCPEIACESGLSCDYNTGICRRFRVPGEGLQHFALDWNKCQDVVCPPGYHCDGTSGVCTRVNGQVGQSDPCEGIICPPGFTCAESRCVQDEPITTEDLDPNPMCRGVRCPEGFECSPISGICHPPPKQFDPFDHVFEDEPVRSLEDESLTLLQCPPNSHYENCAAPCTSTCVDIRPDCKQHDYECIRTCVCDNGFVQVSPLNATCVAARECEVVAREHANSCQSLQCGSGMRCLDGFCNPSNCPPALKPPMSSRCQKIVLVRDRRNCVSLLNECSLNI